jgi:hypothetical protein
MPGTRLESFKRYQDAQYVTFCHKGGQAVSVGSPPAIAETMRLAVVQQARRAALAERCFKAVVCAVCPVPCDRYLRVLDDTPRAGLPDCAQRHPVSHALSNRYLH